MKNNKNIPILELLPDTWEEFSKLTHLPPSEEDFNEGMRVKKIVDEYFKPSFLQCINECGTAYEHKGVNILNPEAEARIMTSAVFVVIEALLRLRKNQNAKNVAPSTLHN